MNVSIRAGITCIVLIFKISLYAQDSNKEEQGLKTKMDAFISETGVIQKFVDYNLSALKGIYLQVAQTRIRKVSNASEAIYFYQIEKKGDYRSSIASIEYSDLLEIIKALSTLTGNVESDVISNPDYLENKFVTGDGFEIGYFVSKGKINWFIKLEKHGSDNTFFVNGASSLEMAFNEAKIRIETLKK